LNDRGNEMVKYIVKDTYIGIKNIKFRMLFFAVILVILTYTGILEIDWYGIKNYGWAGLVSGKLFCGVAEYNIQEGNLQPPVEWITMMMVFAYMFADCIYDDISGFGIQKITRTGRKKWYIAKCICIFIEVVINVALIYLISVVTACLKSGGFVTAERDELFNLTGFYGMLGDKVEFYMNIVVVPFFCLLTVAVWTAVIGMVSDPAKSFMFMSIYIVVGVYYMSPYLIGNQMMLNRNQYVNPDGSGFVKSLWIDVVLIIGGVVYGYIYAGKKDYIETVKC
jgi:hypothetical protein